MDYKNALSLLKIDSVNSISEINDAYKLLALENHPDKGGDNSKMASISEARDYLINHFSNTNLPAAIVEGVELAVREANLEVINHRLLEKKAENISKDVHHVSTNKFIKWRRTAFILGTISAAAILLGKDIPKELISDFYKDEIALPEKVVEPTVPSILDKYGITSENLNVEKNIEANPKMGDEEIRILNSHYDKVVNYKKYLFLLEEIEYKNKRIKERNELYRNLWYSITFGAGIFAGILGWILHLRIQRVESELEDINEELLSKSSYYKLLSEIFKKKIPVSWTESEMFDCVENWLPNKRSWYVIKSSIGTIKFSRLILIKGQEIGFLNVTNGKQNNNYQEIYSINA